MICGGSSGRLIVAAALVGVAFAAAQGQTADTPRTPAELASTIANTITATTPTTPGEPITFASATSHDSVVEIRYVVSDVAAFARFKGDAASSGRALASFFCKEGRRAALEKGVVIHEVFALSGGHDQVDFTIDKSSCDNLPKVAPADAKTLADMALAAAKAENEAAAQQSQAAFHLVEATAHGGVVDLHFVVQAAAAAQVDRVTLEGRLMGYTCGKYRDSIARGLALHLVVTAAGGSSIIDFIVDRSKC